MIGALCSADMTPSPLPCSVGASEMVRGACGARWRVPPRRWVAGGVLRVRVRRRGPQRDSRPGGSAARQAPMRDPPSGRKPADRAAVTASWTRSRASATWPSWRWVAARPIAAWTSLCRKLRPAGHVQRGAVMAQSRRGFAQGAIGVAEVGEGDGLALVPVEAAVDVRCLGCLGQVLKGPRVLGGLRQAWPRPWCMTVWTRSSPAVRATCSPARRGEQAVAPELVLVSTSSTCSSYHEHRSAVVDADVSHRPARQGEAGHPLQQRRPAHSDGRTFGLCLWAPVLRLRRAAAQRGGRPGQEVYSTPSASHTTRCAA